MLLSTVFNPDDYTHIVSLYIFSLFLSQDAPVDNKRCRNKRVVINVSRYIVDIYSVTLKKKKLIEQREHDGYGEVESWKR